MANLKKNFVYQTIYQILGAILPLITAPYISRIFAPEGVGIYSFTSSISNFFVMLAMFGFMNYGVRSVSVVRDDKRERSKVFCEIYYLQIIISLIILAVYLAFILLANTQYQMIYIIQGICILSCVFDVTWYFNALEKISFLVKRNIIIKFISLISIFVFIRQENDLWKYVLIMTLSTLSSSLVLTFNLKENINFVRVSFKNIFKHFKPCAMLFVPLLALSVYHLMDKAMLGFLSNQEQSGYYYNADKIINIPMELFLVIGTVLSPRVSVLFANRQIKQARKLVKKITSLSIFACSAVVFGILSVVNEFVPLFFGEKFSQSIAICWVLAVVIYFKTCTVISRYLYMIPAHKEKNYLFSTFSGLILNVIFNFALIPFYGAMGAAIATLIAEIVVCVLQLLAMRNFVNIFKIIAKNYIYIVFGIVMLISIRFVALLQINVFALIILEILVGAIVYILQCWIFCMITKNFSLFRTLTSFVKDFRKE